MAAAINAELRAAATWIVGTLGPIATDAALRGWSATYRPTLTRSFEQTAAGLIENHLIPFFGARDLREITQADALAFTEYVTAKQSRRTGRPTTVATAETALSILRRVINLH